MTTQTRRWPMLALLGLLSLSGCQTVEKWGLAERFAGPKTHRPPEDVDQDAPVLKPTQKAEIQVALGRVLEKRGDEKGAEQAYLAALQHDPKRAEAYSRMAVIHRGSGSLTTSATAD